MMKKQRMNRWRTPFNKSFPLRFFLIICLLSFVVILFFNFSYQKRKTVPNFANKLLDSKIFSQQSNKVELNGNSINSNIQSDLHPSSTQAPKRTPRATPSKYIPRPPMTMTLTPEPTPTPKRTPELDLLIKLSNERANKKEFPIDIVYTWVNGSDFNWLSKRHLLESKKRVRVVRSTEKSRYLDIGELKYNLRGIEKYIPWYNKVYIVTDNQVPSWINLNHPKLAFVNHTTIIPTKNLPTYNSNNIEFHLSRIPGLSEHFIYLNDDVFIGKPCNPSDFFTNEGKPLIPVTVYNWSNFKDETDSIARRKSIRNDMGSYQYRLTSFHSYDVFTEKFNKTVNYRTAHGYMPFTKSLIDFMWEAFPEELESLETHHFRDYTDVNIPSMSIFVGCGLGMAEPNFDSNATQFISLDSFFPDKIKLFNHSIFNSFCLNSGERTSNYVRKAAVQFLKKYMPRKSSFEI